MKEYILIWSVNDFSEMGGGTEYDFFESLIELENKVNEITKDDRVSIDYCFSLKDEITFKPVEKVTRWEIQQ